MRAILCTLLLAASAATALGHGVTPLPKPLQHGEPLRNLAPSVAENVVYKIAVPPNAARLIVRTDGRSGDVDLLVRGNGYPTVTEFSESSSGYGSSEIVRIEA